MRLPFLFSFFLLIYSLVELSRGQGSGKRKPPDRFKVKKVKKEQEGTRLQCLSCSSDFSSRRLDITDSCYNPAASTSEKIQHTMLTVCPPDSLFCKVEVFRVAGVFAGIARSCGANYCVETCSITGYGAERETCVSCCGGIPTNETGDGGNTADKFNCS